MSLLKVLRDMVMSASLPLTAASQRSVVCDDLPLVDGSNANMKLLEGRGKMDAIIRYGKIYKNTPMMPADVSLWH